MNMRLALLATVVCFHIFTQCHCQDPKDEVEILPEAKDAERRRIKTFWAIMYEVCLSFCVWPAFCKTFCQKFDPDGNPFFNATTTSDRVIELNPTAVVNEPNMWLFATISQICDDDVACIESCLSMEPDEDEPWQDEEEPENVLRALYELARRYFAQCAKLNEKPSTVLDSFTVEQFCREITAAGREFTQQCINLLADML